MKILCTMPGKFGDILWALPTVRALSHAYEQKVDLLLSGAYSPLDFVVLLQQQPYLGRVIHASDWLVQNTAPMTPWQPPTIPDVYARIYDLGYRTWPRLPLPYETLATAKSIYASYRDEERFGPLGWDLELPWITVRWHQPPPDVVLGFTDEHFELKVGLAELLARRWRQAPPEGARIAGRLVNISTSPRWQAEATLSPTSWYEAAAWLTCADVFVGCCSALHVLAVACGTPVVCVEPHPSRHQGVFFPFGLTTTDHVELLRGTDGEPTVDARHLFDAVARRLERRVEEAGV